jgi:predicted tellurium resistance membrane protein TerC
MLKSIGVLIIAVVIMMIEVPQLLERKSKSELVVFSILLAIGVSLSIAHGFGKAIPNPIELLSLIFKPLNNVLPH